MGLFRRGEVKTEEHEALWTALRGLTTEHESLVRKVREMDGEMTLALDQVRKWMRRAVAAERSAGRGDEREGLPSDGPDGRRGGPPATGAPPRSFTMTPARARILARRARRESLAGPEPNGGG